ncbi:hypothetical protein [Oryzifoliimicrobium ureilyticus]|uniref:hypothetical protein n=1 Tax=Oryzifoliimicrobium ureilyticus TaxID=3113724 RepID=UPI003F675592
MDARDLMICQRVFDAFRLQVGFDKASPEAQRIAAITVQLYRQGVRKPDQLRAMVEAAYEPSPPEREIPPSRQAVLT